MENLKVREIILTSKPKNNWNKPLKVTDSIVLFLSKISQCYISLCPILTKLRKFQLLASESILITIWTDKLTCKDTSLD